MLSIKGWQLVLPPFSRAQAPFPNTTTKPQAPSIPFWAGSRTMDPLAHRRQIVLVRPEAGAPYFAPRSGINLLCHLGRARRPRRAPPPRPPPRPPPPRGRPPPRPPRRPVALASGAGPGCWPHLASVESGVRQPLRRRGGGMDQACQRAGSRRVRPAAQ